MHVLLSFLKWGSIGYSLGIVQWDFTRRDHPGNPGRVSESGPVMIHQNKKNKKVETSFMYLTLNIFVLKNLLLRSMLNIIFVLNNAK